MKVLPYLRVDDTVFDATFDDVERRFGRPVHRARNAVGLDELDYGHTVFRFQAGGRLEEVTMQARVLDLGVVAVPFAHLGRFVQAQDEGAFRRAGFVISPRYGIAFVPDCPSWVTALAAHSIDAWRAL